MLLKWWPFINPINYKWWLRIVSLLKHEKGGVINTRETISARISRLCPGSVNSWAFPWTVELSHLPAAAFPSFRRPSSTLCSIYSSILFGLASHVFLPWSMFYPCSFDQDDPMFHSQTSDLNSNGIFFLRFPLATLSEISVASHVLSSVRLHFPFQPLY